MTDSPEPDMLQAMFDMQMKLNQRIGVDPPSMDQDEQIKWVLNYCRATSQELADATRRYYDFCIEVFGVERCMFESNFPVDKLSCSYAVVWNAFKRIASGASADEKAALFHDTAARVYSL